MEKEYEKKKNINLLTVIVLILLIIAVGYIVYGKVKDFEEKRLYNATQAGAYYGYEQAILQVAQLAVTCQEVPLKIGNQTLNVIAVDCLQRANNSR